MYLKFQWAEQNGVGKPSVHQNLNNILKLVHIKFLEHLEKKYISKTVINKINLK